MVYDCRYGIIYVGAYNMLRTATRYFCLFIALIIVASAHAKPRCNDAEFPPIDGATGYQPRSHGSERCEGLYRSKISSGFEIISFTQHSRLPASKTLQISVPKDLLPADAQVNILGNALLPEIYYRMDSTFNARDPFLWPLTDVVERIDALKKQLGVVIWFEQKGRTVIVPAVVDDPSINPAPASEQRHWGHITLRAPMDIEAVYFYKQGDVNGHEVLLEQVYSARQPIEIAVPRWQPQFKDTGLLLVELELKPTDDDDWLSKTISLKVSSH